LSRSIDDIDAGFAATNSPALHDLGSENRAANQHHARKEGF
jgi:hypothetical protein